jgi:cardiolipin synthase
MPVARDIKPLSDRVLTVPNALTLFRILMAPVVVALLLAKDDGIALAVFLVAAITDFLDGRIARRRGPTRIGQMLDPIADRLILSSSAIVLAAHGFLPAWAVAILVGRDILTLFGSFVFGGRVRVNPIGKAATALLMTAVAVVIFEPGELGDVIFQAGFILSLVAAALYVLSIFRMLKRGEFR